jgi:hypothetical protein
MPTRSAGWLRSPFWDAGLLAFGWLPFYGWILVASIGTTHWGSDGSPGFTAALAVALALNFVHRQYVLVLVYGDPESLGERPRTYAIAPVLALLVVGGALWSRVPAAQSAVLAALGIWNVWHVIQQRYGLLRVYSARARGGLESREAARADKSFLWSSVAVIVCATAWLQARSLEGVSLGKRLLSVVSPLLVGPTLAISTGATLMLWSFTAWRSWRIERASSASLRARVPRWIFGASTLCLLAIFVVHGPVVGYLVFGVAHSIEYLAFVHQFGENKYQRGKHNVAALLLGSMQRAPLFLGPLLIGYSFLYVHRYALAYVTYYATTSVLHYLYDGWIWRLRQPRVARPLGVEA